MIYFPEGGRTGSVQHNVELLDVAPTLLAEIGVKTPSWMKGRSLFSADHRDEQPILSTSAVRMSSNGNVSGELFSRLVDPGPPLFGVETVGAVVCNRWLLLEATGGRVMTGTVDGHRGSCSLDRFPTPGALAKSVRDVLSKNGFGELPQDSGDPLH
jgi:hypothetical protein